VATSQRPYFLIAAALVIVDQITKMAVKGFSLFGLTHEGMQLGESIPVLGDVLRLTFVENPGMAFGISFGAGKILLTLATVAISSFLVWYLARIGQAGTWVKIAVMLVLAGAVGNLIDRMFYWVLYDQGPFLYGKVVDFVQVDIPDVTIFGETYTHWPVFNVADSCVSVGVVLLMIVSGSMPTIASLRSTAKAPTDV
jgi:signal peptidase II